MRVERKHYHYLSVLAFNVILFFVLYDWFVTHVHWSILVKDIHSTTAFSIVLIVFLCLVNTFVASIRFAKLLDCKLSESVVLVCLAYGLNNLLPFRSGDILRLYFAKRLFDIDVSKTFTATFMARYLDLIVLLIFGGLLVLGAQTATDSYVIYLFATLVGFSIFAVAQYRILILKPGAFSRFCRQSSFVAKVLDSVETMMAQKQKTKLLFISMLLWLSVLAVYYAFFKINLPPGSFTINEAVLLLFITTLCFAVPYSLAGIGIFEAAVIYCLVKFVGLSATKALALAITFHLVMALPQIALMLLVVLRYRKRLIFKQEGSSL